MKKESGQNMTRIAVYGSLRRGRGANRMLLTSKFVETVRIPGYDMYNLYGFPGIVQNNENKEGVVVEVYEGVDDDTLKHLDYYEGVRPDNEARSYYLRREIDVAGKPAFIYVYNQATEHYKKVPSGDWSEVRKCG